MDDSVMHPISEFNAIEKTALAIFSVYKDEKYQSLERKSLITRKYNVGKQTSIETMRNMCQLSIPEHMKQCVFKYPEDAITLDSKYSSMDKIPVLMVFKRAIRTPRVSEERFVIGFD